LRLSRRSLGFGRFAREELIVPQLSGFANIFHKTASQCSEASSWRKAGGFAGNSHRTGRSGGSLTEVVIVGDNF